MFRQGNDENFKQVLEGVRMKTLCHGDKTTLVEFRLSGGANLPRHSHPHEQTGYLVSGKLRLTVGNESCTATAGDSWCIAGEVEHQAEALSDCVAIEVFAPRREEYIA